MLRIQSVAIQCCVAVGRLAETIARRDAGLADQMRRAMASVVLNIAEGYGSQGKLRNARYHNAIGSAHEVTAALQVAHAFGYVGVLDAALLDALDRVRATLFRIVRG